MGKYAPLREFLIDQDKAVVAMSFEQIEALIGQALPASKSSRAFWSNNPDNNVMTREWLAAGFVAEAVDLNAGTLKFRKREEHPVLFEGETAANLDMEATGRDPLFGCMRGTLKILPDVDYTKPAAPDWAKVYDDR
ncbi:DUF7662 domain-containing protein [Aquibium microcysteis]|uniref:DUF7662 domain-containing protein n=1 Tax=Aquibium microcysteis TaxID=675281 RepID=UPI00165D09E1|nr:hypothetical protein [Aquibium microcysteis]